VQLHAEIRDRGFTGKQTIVKEFIATLRTQVPRLPAAEEKQERRRRITLSPRRLSWLLTNQYSPKVTDADREAMRQATETCPEISSAATLGTQFCKIVRERKADELSVWLEAAKQSGIAELRNFAAGLIADRAAVEAALSLTWSNEQTEGQVNRLKFLKRQMYEDTACRALGRASFDLLKVRVVPNR
jgi:transposase